MLNTTNFDQLIEPKHRQFFYDGYYSEIAQQYKKLFKDITMGKPTETWDHVGAFGMWDENTEGGKINISEMSQGEIAEYTTQRYDNSYIITHEMMKYDLSGIISKGYGKVGGQVKSGAPQALGKGVRSLEETKAAMVLGSGFANTGYDGVAFFSASHPLADSAEVKDNLVSGALSPSTLKTAITKLRMGNVNEANIIMSTRARYLVVPTSLEWAAAEIVDSFKQAYEVSNTENVLPKLETVVWDYLENTGETTASTNWFVKGGDECDNLVFATAEKPFFGTQIVPGTIDHQCYGVTSFVPTYVNFRNIVGSTGA